MSAALLLAAFLAVPADASWSVLLPGGPQFERGKTAEGLGWASATYGTLAWGLAADSGPGELNAPLIYAQQIYVTGFYAAYRDARLDAPTPSWPPPDPASTAELASAPFRWRNLKNPWVWGAIAAGGGLGWILGRTAAGRRSYADLDRLDYLGGSFGRTSGTLAYAGYWLPLSLGAGVAEEGLFRGILQNGFERRWGPKTGLWAASAAFGAAHVFPIESESPLRIAFAAAAGLYLGRLYQRTGYRLEKPIAAHFWWDAAVGLAVFFANPKENALGARASFAF